MIHILGAGNIGCLIATALARQGRDVTLLMRGSAALRRFKQADQMIRIHTPRFGEALYETPVQAETVSGEASNTLITKLIITVKAFQARKALESVIPRLAAAASQSMSPEILLVHNGMGVREKIDDLIPVGCNVLEAVTTAGSKATGAPYTFVATGTGTLSIGIPEASSKRYTPEICDNGQSLDTSSDSLSSDLVSALVDSTDLLITETVPQTAFLSKQYEKLVINAAINPMTALLGCANGALLQLDGSGRAHNYSIMASVVYESCRVIKEWHRRFDADKERTTAINSVLDPERMLDTARSICEQTSGNISSMLADLDQGHLTEIDYINGHVARLAREIGTWAPVNSTLRALIHMKMRQTRHELANAFVPLKM